MKGILWARLQSDIPLTPLYPKGQPHHITLRYGAYRCWWFWLEGVHFVAVACEGVALIAQALAHNHWVQAISVKLPWWTRLLCTNPHPHITVSWIDGAKAKEANEMLSQPHTSVPIRLAVECRIEFKLFHD